MRLPSRSACANPCPRCHGCPPDDGPHCRICQCGADWASDLTTLIRVLAGLLENPGPPDPPRPVLPPVPPDRTPEETS